MEMMKRYFYTAFVLLLVAVGAKAQSAREIQLNIKCPASRSGVSPELVSIKWSTLLAKNANLISKEFVVVDQNGAELPYQLEYKGSTEVQNLLVPLSVAAGKSIMLKIRPGKPAPIISKVYGRYVPERKDDFAWENDRIAFRMYGKALESTNENAYGIDVWAKRTDKMILDKWYKTGDYHADHGDGLDYYSVGFTLGAGDVAPYVGEQIGFSKNYRKWKILDNGPLRFSFQLDYDEWQVAGMPVRVTKIYTLDAGSQLNRVDATFHFSNKENMLPIVVGIVKRKEPGVISMVDQSGITSYWEPEHGADGILGIGTITLQNSVSIETDTHLLQKAIAKNGVSLSYYTGAAWNKAGVITNAEEWLNYLQAFKKRITSPLIITIK